MNIIFISGLLIIIIFLISDRTIKLDKKNINTEIYNSSTMIIIVLTLIIAYFTYLETIKKPEIEVEVFTYEGFPFEYYQSSNLYVEKYSNGGLYYYYPDPAVWTFKVTNKGERTAHNIVLSMYFDEIIFSNEGANDFALASFVTGFGGYAKLIYNKEIDLLPGESILLPRLPFGKWAYTPEDNCNQSKLYLSVYADDISFISKTYNVDIRHPMDGEISRDSDDEVFFDLVKKLDIDLFSYDRFDFDKKLNISDIDIETLKFGYYYSLNRIGDENINFKQYALIFGRVYYRQIYSDENVIENKIKNDMNVFERD